MAFTPHKFSWSGGGLNKHESITNLELSPSKFNWSNAAIRDLPRAMKGNVLERNAVWASARKGLAKHESFKTNPESFAWASVPHGGK